MYQKDLEKFCNTESRIANYELHTFSNQNAKQVNALIQFTKPGQHKVVWEGTARSSRLSLQVDIVQNTPLNKKKTFSRFPKSQSESVCLHNMESRSVVLVYMTWILTRIV